MGAQPVLVVGAARSGTTWVSEVLARTPQCVLVSEPDEAPENAFATRARAGLGAVPIITEPSRDYERLWDTAFSDRGRSPSNQISRALYEKVPDHEKYEVLAGGSPRLILRWALALSQPVCVHGPGRRVVRSVQSSLALDWLLARYSPATVLVRRNPLDVIASRLQLGFRAAADQHVDPPPGTPARPTLRFDQMVWLAALEMHAYDEAAARHPEIVVVEHEELCAEPVARFREFVAKLGLEWTTACEVYLRASDRPGSGFDTQRVAKDLPGKWRQVLTFEQMWRAEEILGEFSKAKWG